MTDIMIRILLAGLGVVLIFFAVSILVVGGVARSIRSLFAPRVIIVQQSPARDREPTFIESTKRAMFIFVWLMLLLVFFGPHSGRSADRANQAPAVTGPSEPHRPA
jgi:Na+-transporting methylmalonyl-CoA/oxaloacetate decarboxylase gamma subunit